MSWQRINIDNQGSARSHSNIMPVRAVDGLRADGGRLLQLLHQEVTNISKFVVASASAFNAAGDGRYEMKHDISIYLPEQPSLYPALAGRLSDIDVCVEVLSSLQTFHSRVRFVTGLSQQYIARLFKSLDHEPSELEYVMDAWQSLSAASIDLIYEMAAVICAQQRGLAPLETERVVALLRAVGDGESPCVQDGRMTMPEWAERRGDARIPVYFDATLNTDTERTSVRVIDISRGGLGLEDAPDLPAGSAVIVELAAGRCLDGKVRWAEDGRCGIKFNRSLLRLDPLLNS